LLRGKGMYYGMRTREIQAHGRSPNRRRWPVGILLAAGLLLSTDALLPALAWPTTKPAISSFEGKPRVGQTLTVVPDDNDRYKWQRCNTSCGEDDAQDAPAWQPDILGSEGTKADGKDSYTLTSEDLGYKIRVVGHTVGQGENRAPQASTPVGPVEAAFAAPQNTALPTISGEAREGKTLTATDGTWTGNPAPNFTYQWQRSGAVIAGADESSYALTPDDVGNTIRVVVTGSNSEGSSAATSAATASVEPKLAAPQNTALPTISGEAREGKTLTATDGTWTGNPAPTFTYQWLRSGADIAGANQSSYQLTAGDVGNTIRVVVTGSNSEGSATATSAATASVKPKPPVNQTAPTVGGTAQEGKALFAIGGTWQSSAAITTTFQWQRSSGSGYDNIASGPNYMLTSADIGKSVRVVETADNGGGTASAASQPVGPVSAAPPSSPDPGPSITGEAVEGGTLTADPGEWASSQPITSFGYQWQRSGSPFADIPGATGQSYTLTGDDVGHEVRVAVTASNSGGTSQPYYSPSAGQVQSKPAPQPQPEPQQQQQEEQPVATQSAVPPPVANVRGNIEPAGPGQACAIEPGSNECVPIDKLKQVSDGAIVDTTNTFVRLHTAMNCAGDVQSVLLWAGAFRFTQTDGCHPLTQFKLVDGVSSSARTLSTRSSSGQPIATAARVSSSRRLWGNGKGRYRTKGRYSSAAVRGTHWLVIDRRDGTLTRVRRGVVVVRDFVRHLRVVLGAGGRYLARRR
jgi:hypothetical protein